MAAYNKIYGFVQDLCQKVHNLNADVLTIALTTMANKPAAATATPLSNITQISYTNLSARVPTNSGCTQTSGTAKLVLQDLVLTASGAVAAFGAIVLYNATAASSQMISWWEYGSDVTLANTETFTIDFDQSGGVLTVA